MFVSSLHAPQHHEATAPILRTAPFVGYLWTEPAQNLQLVKREGEVSFIPQVNLTLIHFTMKYSCDLNLLVM